MATACLLSCVSSAPAANSTFFEHFNDLIGGNFNGGQTDTNLDLVVNADLPDWSEAGGGTVHAVDHANITGNIVNPRDFAPMIWQDNVLTLNSTIAGSNILGQTYTVSYQASPAIYQGVSVGGQGTTLAESLLIEILYSGGSVKESHSYQPGTWNGTFNLTSNSFQYTGDGLGDIKVRIGPATFNTGHFSGAIDNLAIAQDAIFAEDFNSYAGNQNANQAITGLPVAFGGAVPRWTGTGGNALHAVQLGGSPDWAIMFHSDNAITSDPISGANANGIGYQIEFDYGTAEYAPCCQSEAGDGLLVQVQRVSDNFVLASQQFTNTDSFATSQNLNGGLQGILNYVGDGNGDVKILVSSINPGLGRFQGSLDSLVLRQQPVPEPSALGLAALGLAGLGWFGQRRLHNRVSN